MRCSSRTRYRPKPDRAGCVQDPAPVSHAVAYGLIVWVLEGFDMQHSLVRAIIKL